MKIIVIESGSKGNATLIYDEGCLLLIDMGITLTSLKNGLATIDKSLLDIDALLLTHNHTDHTKGVRYLDPLPIYCTKGTYEASNVINITPYEKFVVDHFVITPVSASHDAKDTVGYIIKNKKEKLVYLTDTGMIPERTLSKMKNADYYIIESNHNIKKLHQTNRPASLKLRILSDEGHLSNEASAIYMSEVVGDKTKEIILAHLSEEANEPELALKAYEKVFRKCRIDLDKINLHCASQRHIVEGGK